MKYDIILSGVGGQGVLSLAALIAKAAMIEGLKVKQSEVHGMAQRGGSVVAHLRISDNTISSDLVAGGTADLVLSMEPIEGLRYLDYLKKGGRLVTAGDPVKNIPDYPSAEKIAQWMARVPGARMVDAKNLAKEAGNQKATNVVMVGACASVLPLGMKSLEQAISDLFGSKGSAVIEANLKALRAGAGAP